MIRIYPSLMSADFLHLADDIQHLEPYCNGFHLDIMDNHFVPNLTFGVDITQAISSATTKQLWIHLMVDNPEEWCTKLQLPEKTILSFHTESTRDIPALIGRIKENKWLASIVIKPKTNAEHIFPLLPTIDQTLIMSVEPGFSGQAFLPSALDTLKTLDAHRTEKQLSFVIGMDGGINQDNIRALAQQGAQDFAIASAIFNQRDPISALRGLQGS